MRATQAASSGCTLSVASYGPHGIPSDRAPRGPPIFPFADATHTRRGLSLATAGL
jgi:hypothetical protein